MTKGAPPLGAASEPQDSEDTAIYLVGFLTGLLPVLTPKKQDKARKLLNRLSKDMGPQARVRLYTDVQDFTRSVRGVLPPNKRPQVDRLITALSDSQKRTIAGPAARAGQKAAEEALETTTRKLVEYLTATSQALSADLAKKYRRPENRLKGRPPKIVQFFTMDDDRVDDACRPFHGLKFQADSPGRPVLPLHWGCRCWYTGLDGRRLGQF